MLELYRNMQKRINVQSIGGHIRGLPTDDLEEESFQKREDQALDVLKEILDKHVPEGSHIAIIDGTMEYGNVMMDIYFSMGMKVGAKLMIKLMNDRDDDL